MVVDNHNKRSDSNIFYSGNYGDDYQFLATTATVVTVVYTVSGLILKIILILSISLSFYCYYYCPRD